MNNKRLYGDNRNDPLGMPADDHNSTRKFRNFRIGMHREANNIRGKVAQVLLHQQIGEREKKAKGNPLRDDDETSFSFHLERKKSENKVGMSIMAHGKIGDKQMGIWDYKLGTYAGQVFFVSFRVYLAIVG